MKKYILCSVIALGSLSCTDSFLEEKWFLPLRRIILKQSKDWNN